MYKLESVTINNFWHRFTASSDFNQDVNIIIGKNGTGKTTFMNILQSVLSVSIDEIATYDFESIEIKLRNGQKRKTIKAKIIDNGPASSPMVEYQISRKKYSVRLFAPDERRFSAFQKRKAFEQSEDLRNELASLVSLSSLSVYRLRSGEELEIRDRNGTRSINPVDFRLTQLLQLLTTFQLELSQEARHIASDLQKEVLSSILYTNDDKSNRKVAWEFDREREKKNLTSAFTRLNAIDSRVRKKIAKHVDKIDETIAHIRESEANKTRPSFEKIDFTALDAYRNTQKIIEMSLNAEKRTSKVYAPITLFVEILKEFITDKEFHFDNGKLSVSNELGGIAFDALSSGEKQLLILFIETLLQRNQPYVFLTDEPELSLHISWQRSIIPAIKRLNPNAQVIAATHSPEVASKYRNSICNMEKVISVR
ncbi:TPA: AAA family ATPase [Vibrio parahaemolyticus]|nr:AAA family ATPase [Vibrio parahaemolyticus]